MKTLNSLSGGKTSSYIAANYPADYDVFSLVRIEDQKCKFPDEKIRREVEDRIQAPFIGTAEDGLFKDTIEEYWKDKPVRFAWMNNCVGCFHKSPMLLKKMWEKHPDKLEWFARRERESINGATWRTEITYDEVKAWNSQFELFDDDFNECDSGYCGL